MIMDLIEIDIVYNPLEIETYLEIERLESLIRDDFGIAVPAGSLNGTNSDGGPGVRLVTDIENKLRVGV